MAWDDHTSSECPLRRGSRRKGVPELGLGLQVTGEATEGASLGRDCGRGGSVPGNRAQTPPAVQTIICPGVPGREG